MIPWYNTVDFKGWTIFILLVFVSKMYPAETGLEPHNAGTQHSQWTNIWDMKVFTVPRITKTEGSVQKAGKP